MNISIAGIAIHNDGRVFIARRMEGGEMGGKWEFPGGKAETGESCERSLEREFLEEFGVPVRIGERLGESCFIHRGIPRVLYAYRVFFVDAATHEITDSIINTKLYLTEHSEWKWATVAEIHGMDFTPSDLALLPFIKSGAPQTP